MEKYNTIINLIKGNLTKITKRYRLVIVDTYKPSKRY